VKIIYFVIDNDEICNKPNLCHIHKEYNNEVNEI